MAKPRKPRKDAVEQYFDKHFKHQTRLTESELILHPSSYNEQGLLGDFTICRLGYDHLVPLSGREGPYTNLEEWFRFAGKLTLEKDPDFAYALLYTDNSSQRKPSGYKTENDLRLLYHVTRNDAQNLKELVDHFQPVQMYKPGERIVI